MIFTVLIIVGLLLGISIIRGAPYLPSKADHTEAMLDIIKLEPGELLVDLGCGDGRVLIAAAERDIKSIGYEINPLIYMIAVWRTRKYRDLITVKWANMWNVRLPEQTKAVYLFLIPRLMDAMSSKLKTELKSGTEVVSYAFKFTELEADEHEPLYVYRF